VWTQLNASTLTHGFFVFGALESRESDIRHVSFSVTRFSKSANPIDLE